MDVVHFAETHGHDQDRIRPNAWPYRDYLIASFNHDTPYRPIRPGAGCRRCPIPRRAGARRRPGHDRRWPLGRELAPRYPRRQHRPPDRPLHRPRRHGHHGDVHIRQRDGPLRTVPRPQVRPDHPGRLLQPPGGLRRGRQGGAGLRHRSGRRRGCGDTLASDVKESQGRDPALAAWLGAELSALPPAAVGLRRGQRVRPRRQPQAAGRSPAGPRPAPGRHPPARRDRRAGHAELRGRAARRGSRSPSRQDESARRVGPGPMAHRPEQSR